MKLPWRILMQTFAKPFRRHLSLPWEGSVCAISTCSRGKCVPAYRFDLDLSESANTSGVEADFTMPIQGILVE